MYNYLIGVFSFFISIESRMNEKYLSDRSEQLKDKIMKYSHIYDDDYGENVSIYFYKNEVINLMNVLIFYIGINTEKEIDYFADLEKIKGEYRKNKKTPNTPT